MISINQLLKDRILILDGGMGSMLQRYKLRESDYRGNLFAHLPGPLYGNGDLLCLTRPDIIQSIHEAYLQAGADIIETNSLNMTAISMIDYGIEEHIWDLNCAAVSLAKEIAEKYTRFTPEKPRFVAGSIGPTSKTSSLSPDVNNPAHRDITFDDLYKAYCKQIAALIFSGVDILLIETAFDTLNVKAALMAAEYEMNYVGKKLPIMLSYTLSGKNDRILSGQTLEAAVASVSHIDLLSIGLNCSFGAKTMKPFIKKLGKIASCYISAYPNAGLPDEVGQYNETPEMMARQIGEYIAENLVNIIGGCCGTTPEHIAAISHLVEQNKTSIHVPVPLNSELILSGLEVLQIHSVPFTSNRVLKNSNFIIIGERCNVAGSKKFLRLIQEKNYEAALKIARQQIEDGAKIIDINLDDGLLNSVQEMTTFLNLIVSEPDIASVPVMIDSSDWNVIEAGLKCLQGKSIVNSISLKNGEEDFLYKAKKIKSYGAVVLAMAFDEKGQADCFERKITVCARMYRLLTDKIGFNPSNIIFDPNVLAIATGIKKHNQYAIDFIRATKWIKKKLPGTKVLGGISNLSFSFRGNNYLRKVMHAIFLSYAVRSGMDMGILNPSENLKEEDIPKDLQEIIESVLFNRSQNAVENLIEYAGSLFLIPIEKDKKKDEWRSWSIEKRLQYAIIKGVDDYLEEDLMEALRVYSKTIEIIDYPLMEGMNKIGNLFGEGKVFLPQVIKTSRIMKKAVAILQPYLARDKEEQTTKAGKILLATVKGDVHDIGKNITGTILVCNNYDVIDIGIMVPSEKIIQKAKEYQVDIIALSGLITPSLQEMSLVALEMEKAGLSLPLLVGGAATSKLHTALKIDPLYHGAVIHIPDASKAIPTINKLLNSSDKCHYIQKIKKSYGYLRNSIDQQNKLVSLDYARQHSLKIDYTKYSPPKPKIKETKTFDICVKNVIPYIHWTSFLTAWKLPVQYSKYFKEEMQASANERKKFNEVFRLVRDTWHLLSLWKRNDSHHVRAIVGFFPVTVENDILSIEGRTIPFLRQQEKRIDNIYKSLIDYICPYGDYIGCFVVATEVYSSFLEDPYWGILEQILCDRLAEAATEYLHEKVRKEYWGYSSKESFTPEELLKVPYQGIRPAPGYPSLPDVSLNFLIDDLLHMEEIGVKLTSNGAMYPTSSIAGLYISHPQAVYFRIGEIDEVQLADYAQKKDFSVLETKKWLGINQR